MTTEINQRSDDTRIILILDDDAIARSAVAAYLRECGYTVIEAARENAARTMLDSPKYDIDIVICATSEVSSEDRFGFSRWLREHHSHVRLLMAATIEKTAKLAADVCEEGPHLRKPYDHQNLVAWIKRLRA